MENQQWRIMLHGVVLAGFDSFIEAKSFVRNSREDGFMVTLWENDGKHLRHTDVGRVD